MTSLIKGLSIRWYKELSVNSIFNKGQRGHECPKCSGSACENN